MRTDDFHEQLAWGQDGEQLIRLALLKLGFSILADAYDYTTAHNRGPTWTAPNGNQTPSPDMLASRGGQPYWIECKKKGEADWGLILQDWEHGIDEPDWHEYIALQRETPTIPVVLVILEEDTHEIIAAPLLALEPHLRFNGYKRGGRYYPMVYFPRRLLVPLEEWATSHDTAAVSGV